MKRLHLRNPALAAALLSMMGGLAASADARDRAARTFKDCETCPEMVIVPPGTFIMGSPEAQAMAMATARVNFARTRIGSSSRQISPGSPIPGFQISGKRRLCQLCHSTFPICPNRRHPKLELKALESDFECTHSAK
jgi:hypothetical protein